MSPAIHTPGSAVPALLIGPEQYFLILIVGLVLALAILILLSWTLVRWFKPKIGRKAYLLAAVPIVLAGVALFAMYWRARPNTGHPKVVNAAKLAGLIKSIGGYANFSFTDLAYFNGKLFVGTNLGLVEVEGGKPAEIYRFQSHYSVVSGPWLDRANRLLWVLDEQTHELVRFDGKTWTRMPLPNPAKGYYSRGDVLAGIRPVGTPEGFWLSSAGSVWNIPRIAC